MTDAPVAIVGAGLAGLACATQLQQRGVPVELYEASDGVGGRVRTDHLDGFTLDRGFQVALTAYPELHKQFNLPALNFQAFDPGALVWRAGRGSVVADPFRQPTAAFSTATAPIGSLADKARIAQLRSRVRGRHPAQLLQNDDVSTVAALRAAGFSERIIERFFTPLVGGIQLDPELRDSRRMFDIIFRMLADGDSAVPAAGMQAIPDQLAAQLTAGTLHLDARVTKTSASSISIEDGPTVKASAVVIATEGRSAADLLAIPKVSSKSVGCVYFAADEPPIDKKLIVLDGTGRGPVLNVAVMSNIAHSYAPAGKHLVVAALPGHTDATLERCARTQLRSWWGAQVDGWEHLATYRIEHAQPAQQPPFSPKKAVRLDDGSFVCGDHRDTASIQGALYSGRRCAREVGRALGLADADVSTV